MAISLYRNCDPTRPSLGVTAIGRSRLSAATRCCLADPDAIRRRDCLVRRAAQTCTLGRAADQAIGLHVSGELSHIFHPRVMSLGDRNGQMLLSLTTVEHLRTRQLFGHLKKDCLVGRERVELALGQHFRRNLQRRRLHHDCVLELA